MSCELSNYKTHMDTNFFGTLKFVHPIAKRMMLRRTHGRIVLVGDANGNQYSIPGFSPYACSKAALEQFANQARAELEAHDIKVHYFIPPPMKSKLQNDQQKQYPLITSNLLNGVKLYDSQQVAKWLMIGMQMNQFTICGTWLIEWVEVLKGQSNYFYSIFFTPGALLIKKIYELNVSMKMRRYRGVVKHQ